MVGKHSKGDGNQVMLGYSWRCVTKVDTQSRSSAITVVVYDVGSPWRKAPYVSKILRNLISLRFLVVVICLAPKSLREAAVNQAGKQTSY